MMNKKRILVKIEHNYFELNQYNKGFLEQT